MTGIIDYGVGNLFSIASSLSMIGEEACILKEPEEFERCSRVILPGVGAFGDARKKLSDSGMEQALLAWADSGRPLLGICLGMQMLFQYSEEFGRFEGLSLIPGRVTAMQPRLPQGLKVPQIGWNALSIRRKHPLLRGIEDGDCVYFVHSFSAVDCEEDTLASCEYGIEVTAAVARDNVAGAQFHPEKSGKVGLAILRNFCEMEGKRQ